MSSDNEYRMEPKDIIFSKECPKGYEKAVTRVIMFNCFTDGLQLYKSSSKGTVYALSLTVNNCLNKYRNLPSHTCRMMTSPSSEGKVANPIFRKSLGMYLKQIKEEGVKGFYIQDLEEGILYHYYYGINALCGDLIALMQLVDRPSSIKSNIPCFLFDCCAGVYNPVSNRYCFPKDNIAKGTTDMKSIGRCNAQFPLHSVYRCGPFIACYANESLYPSEKYPNKRDNLVAKVEEYLGVELDEEDKERVILMFDIYQSLGPDLFLHSPLESGDDERRDYVFQDEEDEDFERRVQLIKLKEIFEMPYSDLIAFDYMHGVSNAIMKFIKYFLGKYVETEKIKLLTKEAVLNSLDNSQEWSNLLPYFYSVPKVVISEAKTHLESVNKNRKERLITPKNILEKENFKQLRCHERMTVAFQCLNIIFANSMHVTPVRLACYCFHLISELYNTVTSYRRASLIQNTLTFVLACFEGLVRDDFMTLSLHMFLHSFHSIIHNGLIKNHDTYVTENSYRIDGNIKMNSRNVIKTLNIRHLFVAFSSIFNAYYTHHQKEMSKDDNSKSFKYLVFNDWHELFDKDCDMLKYLTEQNFQDDFLIDKLDTIPFTTTLDLFIRDGYSIRNRFPSFLYYSEDVFNNVNWQCPVYCKIFYYGQYYYGNTEAPICNSDGIISRPRCIAYRMSHKYGFMLFIMLGFIKLVIRGNPYLQAICYHVPVTQTLNIPTTLQYAVKREDLLHINTNRLCLVSCLTLQQKGIFYPSPNPDYLFFRTDSNTIRQSVLHPYNPLFHNLPK